MAKFAWVGTNRQGETVKGKMEGQNEDAVIARLRSDQITVKSVKTAGDMAFQIGTGVAPKDILIFTRQLATMIDAGLPLVQCMDILATQTENKSFARILSQVKGSIESGSTFSDALGKHPKVFDRLFVNLIAAGEIGGILDTIMGRLGTYIEKAVKLKRQLKSALVYPTSIMCIAILVIVVMLTKVIPVFEKMYEEFKGAKLPAPTQVVINISNAFQDNWYFYFGGAAAFITGIVMMRRTKRGTEIFDATLLKLPVIGVVLRKIVVARFTRTLGTLLSSGVPILDSLEICAKTSGNSVVENAILFAREKIAEGKDMAGPLLETQVFPSMVVQMIGVGEQTGAMDTMLQKIADFYEDEVDVAVASMTALIEPIMMVFLGGIIGGIIVAMYLPVFELAGAIGG
jgi:type IV pilus assembly protein PilC